MQQPYAPGLLQNPATRRPCTVPNPALHRLHTAQLDCIPPQKQPQFVTSSRRSLFGAIVLRFPPGLQPIVYMAVHQ